MKLGYRQWPKRRKRKAYFKSNFDSQMAIERRRWAVERAARKERP